jgi:hypothetical protein
MKLTEWVDASGKKIKTPTTKQSTGNKASTSGSFKNRLRKLIDYAKAHRWSKITKVEILEITDDSLKFIENYDSVVDITYDIYIGALTEAWRLKIYSSVSDDTEKPILDASGMGWVELLKTIREYIIVPVVGTPEYKDLMFEDSSNSFHEWVDSGGKKVTTPSNISSQNNSQQNNSSLSPDPKDQTERYKKLLAKIDSEKKYTYQVKELSNRLLSFVIDNEFKKQFIRILYSPTREDYLVQYVGSHDMRCDNWKTVLQSLVGMGVIKDTSESLDISYAEDFKLYENLWD